jgi:hypothetical protein
MSALLPHQFMEDTKANADPDADPDVAPQTSMSAALTVCVIFPPHFLCVRRAKSAHLNAR